MERAEGPCRSICHAPAIRLPMFLQPRVRPCLPTCSSTARRPMPGRCRAALGATGRFCHRAAAGTSAAPPEGCQRAQSTAPLQLSAQARASSGAGRPLASSRSCMGNRGGKGTGRDRCCIQSRRHGGRDGTGTVVGRLWTGLGRTARANDSAATAHAAHAAHACTSAASAHAAHAVHAAHAAHAADACTSAASAHAAHAAHALDVAHAAHVCAFAARAHATYAAHAARAVNARVTAAANHAAPSTHAAHAPPLCFQHPSNACAPAGQAPWGLSSLGALRIALAAFWHVRATRRHRAVWRVVTEAQRVRLTVLTW
eukprot:365224-Chlamydomonas_euryale.AAC.2